MVVLGLDRQLIKINISIIRENGLCCHHVEFYHTYSKIVPCKT